MGYIKDQYHFENFIKKSIEINLSKIDESDILPIAEYSKLLYGKKCMNDYTFRIYNNPKLLEKYNLFNYLKENEVKPHNMFEAHTQDRMYKIKSQEAVELLQSLNNVPGVYIFENHKQKTLYVGVSINLQERIISSYQERKVFFKGSQVYFKVCVTNNNADAHILEMYFINTLNPLLNGTGNYKETPTIKVTNIPKFSKTVKI
jgi:hypothetical protein